MPALSCLRCSACFLDAVGPRGWRDGCGAQVARCIGAGTVWRVSDGEARPAGPQAAAGTSEMTGGGACGKQARPAPQGAKPVRPCRVSHAAAAWHKARSVGPQAASGERPGGAGNIFAPCVISGSSTRKGALGGKIRAPCILNRPIAPGNGCMGRGCCHLDLEKHAFRADVARKGTFFAHSAKKGCMRCDSCQPRALGAGDSGLDRGKRGTGGGRWRKAALGSGAWVQDAGDGIFLAAVGRLLRGWLCREGEMKKRPHMRPLYVKAISFERLYGRLERELCLSSSRRVLRSSSWGERIRGKLREPWCQQRCGRSYGIPKP